MTYLYVIKIIFPFSRLGNTIVNYLICISSHPRESKAVLQNICTVVLRLVRNTIKAYRVSSTFLMTASETLNTIYRHWSKQALIKCSRTLADRKNARHLAETANNIISLVLSKFQLRGRKKEGTSKQTST